MTVESRLKPLVRIVGRKLTRDWRDITNLFSSSDTRPPTMEDQLRQASKPTSGDRPTIREQTGGFVFNRLPNKKPHNFTDNSDRSQSLVNEGKPDETEQLGKELKKD